LRISTIETNDLAAAFQRAIEDCRQHEGMEASLTVSGEAREMHPVVRDEVYRMGYEAIRNACTHSGGSVLQVSLSYAAGLTVRVTDNGVGMEPAVAAGGRDGHFGVPGMRERAVRIGATVVTNSVPGAGTEVVITVPGRAIFQRPSLTPLGRVMARLKPRPVEK
jgi:signal transduction histidine kinase